MVEAIGGHIGKNVNRISHFVQSFQKINRVLVPLVRIAIAKKKKQVETRGKGKRNEKERNLKRHKAWGDASECIQHKVRGESRAFHQEICSFFKFVDTLRNDEDEIEVEE